MTYRSLPRGCRVKGSTCKLVISFQVESLYYANYTLCLGYIIICVFIPSQFPLWFIYNYVSDCTTVMAALPGMIMDLNLNCIVGKASQWKHQTNILLGRRGSFQNHGFGFVSASGSDLSSEALSAYAKQAHCQSKPRGQASLSRIQSRSRHKGLWRYFSLLRGRKTRREYPRNR